MAFWTAQLAECVEENVDKRNRVGAMAVLPSIHLHQCQGGPPWHWWRWMDGSTAIAPTRFRLSTFSSTHSASCAVQKAICALIWTALPVPATTHSVGPSSVRLAKHATPVTHKQCLRPG